MSENWSEFYRHIETARAAVAHGFETHVQDPQEILRARARKLAQSPDRTDSGERIEVVEFLLAQERYAIGSSYVREVYPLKSLTELPCTPAFVLGIMNVRGQILSVLDLKKFFDLPDQALNELGKVIIVKAGNMELGVLADAVVGVRSLAMSDIQPPLPTLSDAHAEYLLGVTRERMAVLDAGRILADTRIIVDDEVEA